MSRTIKNWASSLLFVANRGWCRHTMLSVDVNSQVLILSPLSDEIANTEWLHSGVLLITPQEDFSDTSTESNVSLFVDKELQLSDVSETYSLNVYSVYFCSPFDVIQKQPVYETRHKLLQ